MWSLDRALDMAHAEGPPAAVYTISLQGSTAPAFEITGGMAWSWDVVVGEIGRRWQVIPFDVAGRAQAVVEQVTNWDSSTLDVQELSGMAFYRFQPQSDAFESVPRLQTYLPCRVESLDRYLPHGFVISRLACAYGVAVMTGRQHGRAAAAVFTVYQSSWSDCDTGEYLSRMLAQDVNVCAPAWVLDPLEQQVERTS